MSVYLIHRNKVPHPRHTGVSEVPEMPKLAKQFVRDVLRDSVALGVTAKEFIYQLADEWMVEPDVLIALYKLGWREIDHVPID